MLQRMQVRVVTRWLPRNDASRAYARQRRDAFREDEGKSRRSDNCRVIYGAVTVGQPVSGGQATGITDGIRLSDWY
ncbi:hypothetical protein FJK68_12975 [Escherichia coli]|nr:hypothetical protein [Escherichia coli]